MVLRFVIIKFVRDVEMPTHADVRNCICKPTRRMIRKFPADTGIVKTRVWKTLICAIAGHVISEQYHDIPATQESVYVSKVRNPNLGIHRKNVPLHYGILAY
jgi:hypothetical protein